MRIHGLAILTAPLGIVRVFHLLLIVLYAFALTSCGAREKVVGKLSQLDVERFSAQAEVLWSKNYQSRAGSAAEIPKDKWLESFHALTPTRVYATEEGLFIETSSFFTESEGVFLLPTSSMFHPASSANPSFEKLYPRLYWFKIKG